MKFKVGDRVRVKEGLISNKSYDGIRFAPEMQEYCGKKYIAESFVTGNRVWRLEGIEHWVFSDEMLEPAPFGKSDLKTGMQVRTNAGRLYMVLENIDTKVYGKQQFILANFEGGFLCGSDYDDELKHVDCIKCDIAEVYDVPATRSILEPLRYAAPIWKREGEPIEITIKEIADWKGVSPKRIKIKEG